MAVATGDGAGNSTRRKICADEKHAWESPSAREQGTWRKKVVIDYKAIMQCSRDPCRLAHPVIHPSTQQHFTLTASSCQLRQLDFRYGTFKTTPAFTRWLPCLFTSILSYDFTKCKSRSSPDASSTLIIRYLADRVQLGESSLGSSLQMLCQKSQAKV